MREILMRLLAGDFVLPDVQNYAVRRFHGPGLRRSTLRRDEGRSRYKPHVGAKQRGLRRETA